MNSIVENGIYTAQSVLSAQTAASTTLNAQRLAPDAKSSDAKTAAKQIETVFLNELMRIMMEQTSFGQDRTVSTYLPAITSELSKSLAERGGIGLADFFLKDNGLQAMPSAKSGASSAKNEKT